MFPYALKIEVRLPLYNSEITTNSVSEFAFFVIYAIMRDVCEEQK